MSNAVLDEFRDLAREEKKPLYQPDNSHLKIYRNEEGVWEYEVDDPLRTIPGTRTAYVTVGRGRKRFKMAFGLLLETVNERTKKLRKLANAHRRTQDFFLRRKIKKQRTWFWRTSRLRKKQ